MKLQVAIDLLSTADALKLLQKVAPYVDIIELGTPLIKQQGLSVVTNVKAAYPDKLVFADMKTMDAGELEANLAFEAGADIMTVLASAGDSTIAGAVKAGKAHGKSVVADMIGVADKAARLQELKQSPGPPHGTVGFRVSAGEAVTGCRSLHPLSCRSGP